MIEPYQAVGLVPTMRGIRHRGEIVVNLEHISHLIKAASWLSSMDLPVRLIAIPEGALQGFNDEVLDLDHEGFARECAIDIPGPETDYLGGLARQFENYYHCGQRSDGSGGLRDEHPGGGQRTALSSSMVARRAQRRTMVFPRHGKCAATDGIQRTDRAA